MSLRSICCTRRELGIVCYCVVLRECCRAGGGDWRSKNIHSKRSGDICVAMDLKSKGEKKSKCLETRA
jgi:hypothetical protein